MTSLCAGLRSPLAHKLKNRLVTAYVSHIMGCPGLLGDPFFISDMKKQLTDVSADDVRSLLNYDPDTGIFTWRIRPNPRGGIQPGDVLKSSHGEGYKRVSIRNRLYYAHRVAFLYMTGRWPVALIDHINGNRSDNRWANLREAEAYQNSQNLTKIKSNCASGCRGLTYQDSRPNTPWRAHVVINKRQLTRRFGDMLDAVCWLISMRRTAMPYSSDAAQSS